MTSNTVMGNLATVDAKVDALAASVAALAMALAQGFAGIPTVPSGLSDTLAGISAGIIAVKTEEDDVRAQETAIENTLGPSGDPTPPPTP